MYYAITVKDGIITGQHESLTPIESFPQESRFAGHEIIDVPEGIDVEYGLPLASYNADWTLKPLSQRVSEGLVNIPEEYELDGEEIRQIQKEEKQPEIDERFIRISQLKAELEATDYKIIKAYEYSLVGIEPPYDMTALYEERQSKRDEINRLIEELNNEVNS